MKSLLICSTSYPATNDADGKEAAGAFVAEFAHNLSKTYRVFVVAPGLIESEQICGNVTVIRFKVDSLPLSLLSPGRASDWSRIIKTLVYGNRKMKSQALKVTPDHILAFWALPSGFWARNAAKTLGVPFSIWCLGSDIWSLAKIPLVSAVLKYTLNSASHTFADGWELCREVEHLSSQQCRFLPSSRTLRDTKGKLLSRKAPYKLAFLGRWHRNKGIDILMESLAQLSNEDWNKISEVRICGGGPLESTVKESCLRLQKLGLPVKLDGYQDQLAATALFMWADFVIIPSRIESIPVVFSDAMQTSCPVICTPVGDLPDLIDRYHVGIAASDTNSAALTTAMHKALHMPPHDYTESLKQAAEHFNSSASVNTFIKAIN